MTAFHSVLMRMSPMYRVVLAQMSQRKANVIATPIGTAIIASSTIAQPMLLQGW